MTYSVFNAERNEFQLLYVAPAESEDDSICCRFVVASLDDPPYYEALSYVWGDAADRLPVTVNGRIFNITTNLHSALKHLRLHDKERAIWADALCINQDIDDEKTQQVSRMNLVYSKAAQVVVWLGEGWTGSGMAIDFLRQLAADANLHLDPSQSPSIRVDGMSIGSQELRDHLIRIFDLPWWKRTWTLQEFVLAESLIFQCGQSIVSQHEMYMARENFFAHKDRCCSAVETNSLVTSFCVPARLDIVTKTRGQHYSVLTPILTFCGRQVTNPQDRVYGMLGLGTGAYANLIEPDYKLSFEEICIKLAMAQVQRTRTLEFLSHVFPHGNKKLPSFIPNWTGKFEWFDAYSLRLDNVNWFSASLNTAADIKLSANNILTVKGAVFDTIETVSSASLFENHATVDPLEEMFKLAGLDGTVPRDAPYCNTENTVLVAFWHTLCGGMETILRDSNRFGNRLKGSTDLTNFGKLLNFLSASASRRAELWDGKLELILLDVECATRGRRFFKTRNGHFGLAPKKSKKGDLVVVLAGGNVPYILQPIPRKSGLRQRFLPSAVKIIDLMSTKQSYSFLGDAYIHGIMDGEVFEHLILSNGQEIGEIVLI